MFAKTINVVDRQIEDYSVTWDAMRAYTASRDATSPDQIWLVQHPAVFTQGQSGKPEHILAASNIRIIQSDRGGQITYHGLGQLIAYVLIDLRRAKLTVRQLVTKLEQAVINTLQDYAIYASTRQATPGVYVDNAKICSLGLRVRHGYSYHGLALNVAMDLAPFLQINPCGLIGMKMTQLKTFVNDIEFAAVQTHLCQQLLAQFATVIE